MDDLVSVKDLADAGKSNTRKKLQNTKYKIQNK